MCSRLTRGLVLLHDFNQVQVSGASYNVVKTVEIHTEGTGILSPLLKSPAAKFRLVTHPGQLSKELSHFKPSFPPLRVHFWESPNWSLNTCKNSRIVSYNVVKMSEFCRTRNRLLMTRGASVGNVSSTYNTRSELQTRTTSFKVS